VGHHDDGLEFGRIEPELGIEVLVDHQRRRRRRKQGVAIGSRVIGKFGADVSGGPRAVLNDDRLSPFARQPFADKARNGVGGPAGGERYDDFDGAIRIVLRHRRTDGGGRKRDRQQQRGHGAAHVNPCAHRCLPGVDYSDRAW
jgi:hypothetical protein